MGQVRKRQKKRDARRHNRQYMTVAEARPFMDNWAAEENAIQHANHRELVSRLLQHVAEFGPDWQKHLESGGRLHEHAHRGGRPRGPKGLTREEGAQLYAEIRGAVAGRLAALRRRDRNTWLAVTATVAKLCAGRFNGDEPRARRYVRNATETEFGGP